MKKAPLLIAEMVLVVMLLGIAASSWADDDDSKVFPNRMHSTPPPDAPKARVTAVPAGHDTGANGALESGHRLSDGSRCFDPTWKNQAAQSKARF